jgi:hypothetical protein
MFTKKAITKFVLAMVASASTLFVSHAAQARTLYWTGEAYLENNSWRALNNCRAAAYNDGDAQVRQSCMDDYGISWRTCQYAEVVNTINMRNEKDDYGNTYCKVRVFIEVP